MPGPWAVNNLNLILVVTMAFPAQRDAAGGHRGLDLSHSHGSTVPGPRTGTSSRPARLGIPFRYYDILILHWHTVTVLVSLSGLGSP